jgi:hypothetical protein
LKDTRQRHQGEQGFFLEDLQAIDLCLKVRILIGMYGDIPYIKAVGGDVVERRFHRLLDCFLKAPNIAVVIDFDRKYASRIFSEDPAVELK